MNCARQVVHFFQIIPMEFFGVRIFHIKFQQNYQILKCPLKIHRYVQLIMTCARQVVPMDVSSYAQSSLLLSMLFGVLLNSGNSIILEYSHACAGLTMTLGVIILCIHIERKCFSHACVTVWMEPIQIYWILSHKSSSSINSVLFAFEIVNNEANHVVKQQ